MKREHVFFRMLLILAAATILLAPGAHADPTPSPHRKKHPVKDTDADSAPSPSPSPKRSTHQQKHHTGDEGGQPDSGGAPADEPAAGFHRPADEPAQADVTAKRPEDAKQKDAPGTSHAALPAATSTIEASELRDFEAQPEPVRNLINSALDLTRRNLTYTYGSADPANGGMDCSGTIYYLLKGAGYDNVARSASEQYSWVRQQSRFYAVLSKKEDSFELKEMRPGDLLFWTGTYNVDHDPPVTHTMLYLGRRKQDGKPVMMGASDGRPYNGEKRNGVSVFDFKMPAARSADSADATTAAAPDHTPDFVGYGPIPGMAERNDAANRQAAMLRNAGKDGAPSHP